MPTSRSHDLDTVGTCFREQIKVFVLTAAPVGRRRGDRRIHPGEDFAFGVSLANTGGPLGVGLTNVRFHLRIEGAWNASLIVPDATPPLAQAIARAGHTQADRRLTPGAHVDEMFLFFSDERSTLAVGQVWTIVGLTGSVGPAAIGTRLQVQFGVLAELDVDFLEPKVVDSATATQRLTVVARPGRDRSPGIGRRRAIPAVRIDRAS